MAEIKLKKIAWLRRRFVKSELLPDLLAWSDVTQDLKEAIQSTSAFQLLGEQAIVEIDSLTGLGHVLVEVVGVPKSEFPSIDFEAREVLVFDYPKSGFEVDFMTLMQEAKTIISGISRPVDTRYHIVFDGNHLALHFFI